MLKPPLLCLISLDLCQESIIFVDFWKIFAKIFGGFVKKQYFCIRFRGTPLGKQSKEAIFEDFYIRQEVVVQEACVPYLLYIGECMHW